MTSNDGFWSYVHDDDIASFGKVVQLGRDLKSNYEMITGTNVDLFLDRDSLDWGDAWKSVIKSNLGTVAFFIPVITPAYFNSPACRSELGAFAERTHTEGLKGLLLPVLWVPVQGLEDEDSHDPLMQVVQDRQWEDWTDLRHAERGSETYSRTLQRMAERIKRANDAADRTDAAQSAKTHITESDGQASDEEGRLEVLARMETDVESWEPLLNQVAEGLHDMGTVAEGATIAVKSDPRARSFAGRLLIVRDTASKLQDPANRIEQAGVEFAQKVSSVDEGIRLVIDAAPEEIADNPSARDQYERFFDQLRTLDLTAETVDEQLTGFVTSIAPLQKQSRDLKKPVLAATTGVTRIRSALGVIHDWIAIIDSIDLELYD